MKKIISGLLTIAMLITSPGVVNASNIDESNKDTITLVQNSKEVDVISPSNLYPTTIIEEFTSDFKYDEKFAHYIYGTGNIIENEHNISWDEYGTKYFYNQYGDFERFYFLDELEMMCNYYLRSDLDAVEGVDEDGNIQYHTGYFLVQNWTTQNEVYKMVEIFKYNNPQYYFLNDVIRITNIEGITVVSIGIYDEFAHGTDRAKATNNLGAKINEWKNALDLCETQDSKVEKLQELICKKVNPATKKDSLSQSAYSVLCSNESACAGYSKAFSLICDALGMDCISVTSEDYMWNKVRVEDQWYNIDIFSADKASGIDYTYFLRSDEFYERSNTKLWRNKLPNCLLDSNPSDNTFPGMLPVVNERAQMPKFRVTGTSEQYNAFIGSPTIGATIYYTLDGSEPSMANSKSYKYTDGISFEAGDTLKVIAIADGYYDSEVITWDGTLWEEELSNIYKDGVFYDLKVNDTLVAYHYDDYESEILEIPEEVDGYKVSGFRINTENSVVKKIVLPKTLQSIECKGFTNLEEIVVDKDNPFYKVVDGVLYDKKGEKLIICPPMYQESTLILDENVKVISDYAFNGCINLVKIELPDDVYQIGNFVFNGCTNLKEIHVEYEDVEKYLSNMEYDEECYIALGTFENTPALENVDIPGGITYAGGMGGDRSTATFTVMPNYNANEMMAEIFYSSKKVISYTGSMVDSYCASQGLLFECIKDIDKLIYQYKDLGNNEICITAVKAHSPKVHTIPETIDGKKVVEISTGYLSGVMPSIVKEEGSPTPTGTCSIEKLILPKTLKVIGTCAFFGVNIKEIVIPNGVERIDGSAFGYAKINKLTIPESVKYLGWGAFSDTEYLTEINLLCDVRCYEGVFDNSGVKEITFPEGVCSISISNMKNIEKLTLPNTLSHFNYGGGCDSLREINVPGEVFDVSGDYKDLVQNGCVINGDKNSAMEKVANEYGVTFNVVGEIEKTDFTFADAQEEIIAGGEKIIVPARDGSIYIDNYFGNESNELIIPNSYGNKKIVGIKEYGVPTYIIGTGVKSIIVEEGIKDIEQFCILNRIPCEEIRLPKSISYIDDNGLFLGNGSGNLIEIYGYLGSYVENWVKRIKENVDYPINVEFRDVEVDKFVYELVSLEDLERGKNSLILNWSKVDDAQGYNIYRKTLNSSWEKIHTVVGNDIFTFTDNDLKSGNEYYYCIRGYKDNLECNYNEKSIYYLEMPKIKDIKQDGYKIEVTWEAVNGADSYCLEIQKNDDIWLSYNCNEPSYTLELYEDMVDDGDVFRFKVQAFSNEIYSYSYYPQEFESITFKKPIKIQVPFQPTDLRANLTSYNAVKLTWTQVDNANGYLIYFIRNGMSDWKLLGTTQSLEYKKSGLIAGTNYKFRVISYCVVEGEKHYNENYYNETSINTLKKLAAPANLKAILYGHDDVKVTWNKVAGANGYYVYFKKSSVSKYTLVGKTTEPSFKKSNLTDNVTYNVKIVPYYVMNGVEVTGGSLSTTSIDTLKEVKAPKTFSLSLYGYDDVKVSWTKCLGATGYYIYAKKASATNYTYLGSTKELSFKKANLTDGVKYTFKIIPYYTKNGKAVKSYYSKTANIYTLKKLNKPVIKKYSSGKIKISWNNIEGESGYQISRSTSKTGTGIISTIGSNTSKYKVVSATKGKTYYYKVRTYKVVGGKKIYGPWSSVTSYKLK